MDVLWKVSKKKFAFVLLLALAAGALIDRCNRDWFALMVGAGFVAAAVASFKETRGATFHRAIVHRFAYAAVVSALLALLGLAICVLLMMTSSTHCKEVGGVVAFALYVLFLFAAPLAAIERLTPFRACFASMQYWIHGGLVVILKSLVIFVVASIPVSLMSNMILHFVPEARPLMEFAVGVVTIAVTLFYACVLIHIDYVYKGSMLGLDS